VAIKRHFAGARGLGNRFDADPANAASMEEVLSAVEDAVAGLSGPGDMRLRIRTRFFFIHGA
jgi:hypothetical protein